MNIPFPGAMAGLDPSKLKPETLMKLTQLMQELPPGMISRIQTLMHNAMAGFDVRVEMAQWERELPPGFREKMAGLMYEVHSQPVPSQPAQATVLHDERDARLTVLRAVADGSLAPEEALQVLFPES